MNKTEPKRSVAGYLQSEIEAAFSELIHVRWGGIEPSWRPNVDIYEMEDAFLVVADLPGMTSSEVQLETSECCVTICGSRQTVVSVSKGRNVVSERARGRFCRKIDLPGPINPDKAKARFEEGVYEIFLPKKENSLLKHGG